MVCLGEIAPRDAERRIKGIQDMLGPFYTQYHNHPYDDWIRMNPTGFLPVDPSKLVSMVQSLLTVDMGENPISMELGSGLGGWTLMCAALGISSYGIEINKDLVTRARELHQSAVHQGLIDSSAICRFAEGNYYRGKFDDFYKKFIDYGGVQSHEVPTIPSGDPYEELGVGLGDASIVYAYVWTGQFFPLSYLLSSTTKAGTVYVLPHGGETIGRYSEFNVEMLKERNLWRKGDQNKNTLSLPNLFELAISRGKDNLICPAHQQASH